MKVLIKSGRELTNLEIDQINLSKQREFKAVPLNNDQLKTHTFFLLEDEDGNVLSQGQLLPINGVKFNDQSFDIFGIGGIIANQKGRGFGRIIMEEIKKYLINNKKTGVGFTRLDVEEFYRKSGFETSVDLAKRFIYLEDGKEIINQESDFIVYLDSPDNLMSKILQHPNIRVLLPRRPDW